MACLVVFVPAFAGVAPGPIAVVVVLVVALCRVVRGVVLVWELASVGFGVGELAFGDQFGGVVPLEFGFGLPFSYQFFVETLVLLEQFPEFEILSLDPFVGLLLFLAEYFQTNNLLFEGLVLFLAELHLFAPVVWSEQVGAAFGVQFAGALLSGVCGVCGSEGGECGSEWGVLVQAGVGQTGVVFVL